jgi:5-(carboxyamino)imidazole ribonucleotide synthase
MGKTVGILGGGQLGRMLVLAGYPLGLQFRVLEPDPDVPAGRLAEQIVGGYDDQAVLSHFASGIDIVTYEFENVPVTAARLIERHAAVYPPPAALEAAQDRLVEKNFFRDLGIPTAQFLPIDSLADLEAAVASIGLPAVLKTRRFGYDGKGQWVLHTPADLQLAWEASGGVPLILERFVAFARELSILAARGRDGCLAYYPLVQNHHRDGILRLSRAPALDLPPGLQAIAESYAARALNALNYAGVLAIELFQVDERRLTPALERSEGTDDRRPVINNQRRRRAIHRPADGSQLRLPVLLANEMAPRVHNSGHWTIEGAETSQFENHLRAVLGLPLGATAPRGHAAMLNIIGALPDTTAVLAVPGAHLHLYDKEPRRGRKLGHVTIVAATHERLLDAIAQLEPLLVGEG